MTILASSVELTFTEMKSMLSMTDGNLSVHIRNLQKAGYVAVSKEFVERKPRTSCSLTQKGKEAFSQYIASMENIIKDIKKGS